jgi:hypothetical protein
MLRGALRNITSPITLNPGAYGIGNLDHEMRKMYCKELITGLYDIHPLSVMAEISENYYNNEPKESYGGIYVDPGKYARAGKLFPQNRISHELLSKVRLYEPKLFTSLEAACEILDKAREDSLLGSNGNYSFIGGLGASVTDEEDNLERLSLDSDDSRVKFTGIESLDGLKVNNVVENYNKLFKKFILNKKEDDPIIVGIPR